MGRKSVEICAGGVRGARVGLAWLQVLALWQVAAVPTGGRANLLRGAGGRIALPTLVPAAGLRRTQATAADPNGPPPDGSCTAMYDYVQERLAARDYNAVGQTGNPETATDRSDRCKT